MTEVDTGTNTLAEQSGDPQRRDGWLAGGSLVGALLASICCLGPLVLAMLGVSGAWIGTLTALEPYKPWFAGTALVFIGVGFRRVYFRPKPACGVDGECAGPSGSVLTQVVLWAATLLVLLAITINGWAPWFY